MTRERILLDSNAYFRLARSIRPLLDHEFGPTHYCLYVIDDFEKEFLRSRRLQRKFGWIDEPEYCINRKRKLQLANVQRKEIKRSFDYILNYARSEGLATSPVDMMALSTAFVLEIRVVTDDKEMLQLAAAFGIRTSTTLELMRLMLDVAHIDMGRVRQICEYWQFEKDLPAGFREEYRRLFNEDAPPAL